METQATSAPKPSPNRAPGVRGGVILLIIIIAAAVATALVGAKYKDASWQPITATVNTDAVSNCTGGVRGNPPTCYETAEVTTVAGAHRGDIGTYITGTAPTLGPVGARDDFWIKGQNYSNLRDDQPTAPWVADLIIALAAVGVVVLCYIAFKANRNTPKAKDTVAPHSIGDCTPEEVAFIKNVAIPNFSHVGRSPLYIIVAVIVWLFWLAALVTLLDGLYSRVEAAIEFVIVTPIAAMAYMGVFYKRRTERKLNRASGSPIEKLSVTGPLRFQYQITSKDTQPNYSQTGNKVAEAEGVLATTAMVAGAVSGGEIATSQALLSVAQAGIYYVGKHAFNDQINNNALLHALAPFNGQEVTIEYSKIMMQTALHLKVGNEPLYDLGQIVRPHAS